MPAGHKLNNIYRQQASLIILAKKWTVKIPAVMKRIIFSLEELANEVKTHLPQNIHHSYSRQKYMFNIIDSST